LYKLTPPETCAKLVNVVYFFLPILTVNSQSNDTPKTTPKSNIMIHFNNNFDLKLIFQKKITIGIIIASIIAKKEQIVIIDAKNIQLVFPCLIFKYLTIMLEIMGLSLIKKFYHKFLN